MMNHSNVKRAVDMITKIPLPKQRIYHAGGMADVVKMSFLSRLLSHTKAGYALGNTPAFTYLDLFGGKGLYDLSKSTAKDQAALKRYWTHVRGGFRKSFTPGWPFYPFVNVVNLAHANPSLTAPPPRKPLLAHPQIPASPLEVPIKGHVETLKSAQKLENPRDHIPSYTFLADQAAPLSPLDIPLPKQLSVFPGGPFAAKAFMRPRDQAIIVEQDTASFNELKSVLKADKDSRIELINADPEVVLNRLVPPRTAGGVVYMDMGHNLDGEHMAKMQRLFTPAIKAWPVATYVITYPIIDARPFDLLEDVVRTGARYCLNVEVYNNFADTSDGQARGVGIAIVNPPPEFLQEARMMTYELQNIFNVPELSEQARPATAAWMVNGGNVDYEWPDRFKLNMKYKPGLDEMVLRREVFDLPTQKPEDDPKYADLLKRQGKRMITKEKKIRGMQDKYNATAPGSKEEAQHDWRWFRKGQLPIQPIVPDNYPESFAEQVKLFSSTSAADWRAFRKARIEAEDRRLGGALTAKAPNRKR